MSTNPILDAALAYAGRGWPVFRLSGSKVPLKGTHGHLDATTDAATIEAWFGSRRGARLCVGLATGELVVLDADGPGGLAELTAMARPHGGLPRTLVAQTSRGFHFYYRRPAGAGDLRTLNGPRAAKGDDGLDIKAGGGYVVLPPSVNRTGFCYRWIEPQEPICDLPAWLVDWLVARGASRKDRREARQLASVAAFGPRPEWLPVGEADAVASRALTLARGDLPPLSQVLTLLRRIPASIGNQDWFRVGCMIHDWDSGHDGLAIFKAWSRTSTRHDWAEAEGSCEKEWRNMSKPKPGLEKVTVWSLEHEATKYAPPEVQQIAPNPGKVNGNHAEFAHAGPLSTEFAGPGIVRPVRWVDTDEDGNPRPTCTNAAVAIAGLGIGCSHDTFHDRLLVGGHFIQQWAGDLTDNAVHMLRRHIKRQFRFDPGEKNCRDAATQLCLENPFNPVVDYLAGLRWDGTPRIGRWVTTYLGAPDEPLGQEFGRLMLLAAVRRARRPGCKFDQILVWEGVEGTGKSTALRILAGDDNFSDQRVLGVSEREQQEAVAGVWLHEIAELAGMRRAEVEAVKAFASKTEDRARPAYGRFRVDRKRQCVFVATTNAEAYLKSDTGDRRFWPLRTGRVALDALERDRDQLWAEAAYQEARGESLVLDWRLWPEAARVQASRQEMDPWYASVARWIDEKNVHDTSVLEVLENHFHMHPREIGQTEQNRVARTLQQLNFERYQKREGERRFWRYRNAKYQ